MTRDGSRRRRPGAVLAAVVLAACARRPPPADARRGRPPSQRPWLKGQTHVHSGNSGDSATPPGDVARWYDRHGYDFVVFTDHNFVTVAPAIGRVLAIPGVEITQNSDDCTPPPEPGLRCLLHVNALFVPARLVGPVRLAPATDLRREALVGRAVDLARDAGALAQLNHPNFHYAADATTLAALARRGAALLEVANEAFDSNNGGDARHPSTEALWDAVLTAGATVWAVATDDAHHYDDAATVRARGAAVFTGDRGFVMVRARRDPDAIRAALARGDFYASTGVLLARAERGPDGGLEVDLAAASPGAHRIACIGPAGVVREEHTGRAARCTPPPRGAYVRAVVTDLRDGRRAWVQPVRGL